MFASDIHIVTTLNELDDIRLGWKKLHNTLGKRSSIFQSWEWCSTWCSTLQGWYSNLMIVYAGSENNISAIIPLAIEQSSNGSPQLEATFIGFGLSDYIDVLVDPASIDILALLKATVTILQDKGVRSINIPDVPPWSPLNDVLRDFAQDTKVVLRQTAAEICPYTVLPSSWDAYLYTRSSNTRAHIRRVIRRFDIYNASYHVVDTEDEFIFYLELFISLHIEWWRHKSVPSVLEDDAIVNFLRSALSTLFHQGMLHCSTIITATDTLSIFMTLVDQQRALYYLSGINPKYTDISVGNGHFALLIEDLIKRGFHSFDLLRGNEVYKSRWSTANNMTSHYYLELS